MEDGKCHICKEEPIFIKKWSLCRKCYMRTYSNRSLNVPYDSIKPNNNKKELEFVKNYFKGRTDWVFEPATFKVDGFGRYTPDFYDKTRRVFIEVSGTRQAFDLNREKYIMFVQQYPEIKFEVHTSDGSQVDFTLDKQPNGTWDYNRK